MANNASHLHGTHVPANRPVNWAALCFIWGLGIVSGLVLPNFVGTTGTIVIAVVLIITSFYLAAKARVEHG